MKTKHFGLIILASLTFGLSGCAMLFPATPTSEDPSALQTAAAQTIIAQLTEVAGTLTPEPPPGTPVEPSPSPTGSPTPEETPTPTESPTPEETPTPTETPTQQPPDEDPRQRLGDPDFRDSFRDDRNWPLYSDDHVIFHIADDTLVMRAYNPDLWEGWMISWPNVRDFYQEMTGVFRNCSGRDRYGFLTRAERPAGEYLGYFLGITCDGRYSLRRWDGTRFVPIVDWTFSEHLRTGPGETNRFGLWAEGDRLTIYLNGVRVAETSDQTHREGRIGVFVGSSETQNLVVEVDEVAYWVLP